MTGLEWVRDSGQLTTPIAITNTHSVGVVHDALIAYEVERGDRSPTFWSLPVVAETYDGALNDINGFHVRPEHLFSAMESASDGPVPEGNVGGGTGMMSTTSRAAPAPPPAWSMTGDDVDRGRPRPSEPRRPGTPDGRRRPRGREIPTATSRPRGTRRRRSRETGSIVVIVATDAPLLPHQLRRIAQRRAWGSGASAGPAATRAATSCSRSPPRTPGGSPTTRSPSRRVRPWWRCCPTRRTRRSTGRRSRPPRRRS